MKEQLIDVTEGVNRDAPDGLAFARLAESYLDNGDMARAAELCIEGLKRFPNYVSARLILGRCYLGQSRYNEALTEFRRVCRIDRRCPSALRYIADAYARQNADEQAGAIYAHLLENDPENVDLQYLCSTRPGTPAGDVLAAAGVVDMPAAPSQPQAPPQQQNAAPTAAEADELDLEEDEVDIEEITGSHQAPETPIQQAPAPQPDNTPLDELIEGAETIAMTPDGNAGVSADDITGQDVSYRIEALFGEEEAVRGPGEKPSGRQTNTDPLTELFASGQLDDSSRIDTGRFSMEEYSTEQIEPLSQDALKDEDAFGATMAFDHSMLVGDDSEQELEQDVQSGQTTGELDIEPDEYDLSDLSEDDDDGMSGLSGADVSSRLDEMFASDDSDMDGEAIQLTEEQQPPAPSAPDPSGATHVFESGQLTDTGAHSADTAEIEQPSFLALESEAEQDDLPSSLTDQTAIIESDSTDRVEADQDDLPSSLTDRTAFIESDSPHQAGTDQQAEPINDDTFEIELENDSGTASLQSDASDLLGGLGAPADEQMIERDDAGAQSESAGHSLAGDLISSTEDTSGLSLDQEMSFGGDDQLSLDEMMTVSQEPDDTSNESDAPTGFIVTDEHRGSDTSDSEQVLVDDAPTDDTLEFAGGTQDDATEPSYDVELDMQVPPVSDSRPADDDLFGDTAAAAPPKEPQTKQERAEEAQTLEFARDELEDLVALQGDTQDQGDDDDDDEDRLGDTTTMGSLVEDEAGEVSFQQVKFDDTSAFPQTPPQEQTAPEEEKEQGAVDELSDIDDIDLSSSGLIEAKPKATEAPRQAESEPPPQPNTDTRELTEDMLDARTDSYERPAEQQKQANPFEQYADEISQAHTILFRREDLERFGGDSSEAEKEEQDELHSQISQARTVEFGRDRLEQLARGSLPSESGDSQTAEHPIETADTISFFDDEQGDEPAESADTVEAAPPEDTTDTIAQAETPTPPPADPFLDDTMATVPTDTVVIRDSASELPPSPPPIAADTDPFAAEAELVADEPVAPSHRGDEAVEQSRRDDETVSELPVASPEDDTVAEEPEGIEDIDDYGSPAEETAVGLPQATPADETVAEKPSDLGMDGDPFESPEDSDDGIAETVCDSPAGYGLDETVLDQSDTTASTPGRQVHDTVQMDDDDDTLVQSDTPWGGDKNASIELIVDGESGYVNQTGDLDDTVTMRVPPGFASQAPESSDRRSASGDEVQPGGEPADELGAPVGHAETLETEKRQSPEPELAADLELDRGSAAEESADRPEAARPASERRKKPLEAPSASRRRSDTEESTGTLGRQEADGDDSVADQIASIPDHVLTPTLADIYFHQGQPALAIQIYRRLLELEPDNERIAGRLEEIESQLEDEPGEDASSEIREKPKPGTKTSTGKSSSRKSTGTKSSGGKSKRGPLTGVKIKKDVRERHRRQRRR